MEPLNADRQNGAQKLLQRIVKFYDEKFQPNTNGTKAISIQTDFVGGFSTENHTAWGTFLGGPTGTKLDIYKQDNCTAKVKEVAEDEIPATMYYFLIYLPNDRNTGIIAVQSYTDSSMTFPFREHLRFIFAEMGFKPSFTKRLPSRVIKEFLRDNLLTTLEVTKGKKSKEYKVKVRESEFKTTKISARIANFAFKVSDLLIKHNPKSWIFGALQDLGISFDEDIDEIRITYGGTGQGSVSTSIDKLDEILPKYELGIPDIDPETNQPLWSETHKKAWSVVQEVIEQYGF